MITDHRAVFILNTQAFYYSEHESIESYESIFFR
jgi:hypothetical protein